MIWSTKFVKHDIRLFWNQTEDAINNNSYRGVVCWTLHDDSYAGITNVTFLQITVSRLILTGQCFDQKKKKKNN